MKPVPDRTPDNERMRGGKERKGERKAEERGEGGGRELESRKCEWFVCLERPTEALEVVVETAWPRTFEECRDEMEGQDRGWSC